MLTSVENNHSVHEFDSSFKGQVNAILEQPLTPENIDTYADQSLNNLADIAVTARTAYQQQPTIGYESLQDQETAAFDYFGLTDIETVLDHVASTADELHSIDDLISENVQRDHVIVNTDSGGRTIEHGSGEGLATKLLAQRLKTTLFILASRFDVDVHDPTQLHIEDGRVRHNMMRRTSYQLIEARTLNRSILVCDESGNLSYVFDTTYLTRIGLTNSALMDLNKPELGGLIQEHPLSGRRITYSKNFVQDMIQAIEEPAANLELSTDENPGNSMHALTLRPLLPSTPDILSAKGIADKLGIYYGTVVKAVTGLQEQGELGDVREWLFARRVALGYNERQQGQITHWLWSEGRLTEEDDLTVNALATKLGVSFNLLLTAINDLGDEEIKEHSTELQTRRILTPKQQGNITYELWARGELAEKAPVDYSTEPSLAKKLRVGYKTLRAAIEELRATGMLPEPQIWKFGPKPSVGLSPKEQGLVTYWLVGTGKLVEAAKEDDLSIKALGTKLGVSRRVAIRALKEVQEDENFGEIVVRTVSSRNKPVEVLSARQQGEVTHWLWANGHLFEAPADGERSRIGLSKKLHVGYRPLDKVIAALLETGELGDLNTRKFGAMNADAFSLEQQQKIARELVARGKLKSVPDLTVVDADEVEALI